MTAIYAAMSAVMSDVQAIGKNRKVTEGPVRFSFRGVDDVVQAVGPMLRTHRVVVVPHEVVSVEHERYATKSGAQMDGVTIVIRWRFYADDGSFIEASSAGQSADSGDRAIPKAHSVAYRTVLLQALCIPTDEPDPDSSVHERGQRPQRQEQGPSADQQEQAGVFLAAISEAQSEQELTGLAAEISKANVGPLKDQLRQHYSARMKQLKEAA